MKIFVDYENEFYEEKYKKLGYCITIIDNSNYYFYEFDINNDLAYVRSNDYKYIEEAIELFRKNRLYINQIKSIDGNFYANYDKIHKFKLPIKILQPSKFFLDEQKIDDFDKYLNIDDVCIPVCIINDEYVIISGHTIVYTLNMNYKKMIDVYIDDYDPLINDLVYIAKEHNIKDINGMHKLSHEEYETYWNNIINEIKNTEEF